MTENRIADIFGKNTVPLNLPAFVPFGDLKAYVGPAVFRETTFASLDGKTIVYREHIAGDSPAGLSPFWVRAEIGIKTGHGVIPVPVFAPIQAETLAEALAGYDQALDQAGRAAVADMEAQARRMMLGGGPR